MNEPPYPKRRGRTRDDPAVRRAQILDEAIRIIGERGYYGFALQDLAQRCGLTTGGLLYHYGSKEALFVAVLEEFDRRMEEALWAKFEGEKVDDLGAETLPRELALRAFRAIFDQSVSQPHLMHLDVVLRAEALNRDHPGHEHYHKREDRILGMFALMVRGLSPDPHATARQIYALMSGLELQWLHAGQTFDLLAEWDRAIALILTKGLGG